MVCGWCLTALFRAFSWLEVDAGLRALAYLGLVLLACYGFSVAFRLIIRRGIANAEVLLVAVALLVLTSLWFFVHNAIGGWVVDELLGNADPVLARRYVQDRRWIVRYMALRVVAYAQDDAARQLLLAAANSDSDDAVRGEAITVLGEFHGPLAVADRTFEVWAASERPLVAIAASRVLLFRGHAIAIRHLAEVLRALRLPRKDHSDETQRQTAAVAKFVASCLEEVTGFQFGLDADAWIDWYQRNHEQLSWDPSANRYVTGAGRKVPPLSGR